MKIFFSSNGDPMLLNSMLGMNALYNKLVHFVESDEDKIEIASSMSGKPEPYEELLAGIEIIKRSGPLNLSITNRRWLQLVGSPENLKRYIRHFQFKDSEDGNHHHPEHEITPGYMAKGTMSLIIEVDSERINTNEIKR